MICDIICEYHITTYKVRTFPVESGGKCLVLRIWNIFAQMLVFAVVGFSKCKSLYLNVTGDKYTHVIHIRW